eukprot:1988113-Rhodomonas_salina.2
MQHHHLSPNSPFGNNAAHPQLVNQQRTLLGNAGQAQGGLPTLLPPTALQQATSPGVARRVDIGAITHNPLHASALNAQVRVQQLSASNAIQQTQQRLAVGGHHQAQAPQQDRKLHENDALGYLNEVRRRFGDDPTVYNRFLDIMKGFKAQQISTKAVIEKVSTLFAGHKDLILGFNAFLPQDYRIQDTPEKPPEQQFDSAYNYVARIKQRFINQPEVYKQFLIILQRCGLLLLLDVCLKSAVMGHVFRNPRASYFSVFFVHVTVLQPSFVVH